jgi:hypothetical protein
MAPISVWTASACKASTISAYSELSNFLKKNSRKKSGKNCRYLFLFGTIVTPNVYNTLIDSRRAFKVSIIYSLSAARFFI